MRQMAGDRGVTFRVDARCFPCRDGDRGPLELRIPAVEAVAIEMQDLALRTRTATIRANDRSRPATGSTRAGRA